MLINSKGILRYYGEKEDLLNKDRRAWVVLDVDPNIGRLYHRLIPKYKNADPQRWASHITVVRLGVETVSNIEMWKKHENKEVEFTYDNQIEYHKPYFFLRADSEQLKEIRVELGMAPYRIGFSDFHITVANVKHVTTSQDKSDCF